MCINHAALEMVHAPEKVNLDINPCRQEWKNNTIKWLRSIRQPTHRQVGNSCWWAAGGEGQAGAAVISKVWCWQWKQQNIYPLKKSHSTTHLALPSAPLIFIYSFRVWKRIKWTHAHTHTITPVAWRRLMRVRPSQQTEWRTVLNRLLIFSLICD